MRLGGTKERDWMGIMPRADSGGYEDVTPTCDECGLAQDADSGPHYGCKYDDDALYERPSPPLKRFRLETRYVHKRSEGLRGKRGVR